MFTTLTTNTHKLFLNVKIDLEEISKTCQQPFAKQPRNHESHKIVTRNWFHFSIAFSNSHVAHLFGVPCECQGNDTVACMTGIIEPSKPFSSQLNKERD